VGIAETVVCFGSILLAQQKYPPNPQNGSTPNRDAGKDQVTRSIVGRRVGYIFQRPRRKRIHAAVSRRGQQLIRGAARLIRELAADLKKTEANSAEDFRNFD
jgi:hypothetical protein